MYKRVLLKLSGEQLSGAFDNGFDTKTANYLAQEIKKIPKKVGSDAVKR